MVTRTQLKSLKRNEDGHVPPLRLMCAWAADFISHPLFHLISPGDGRIGSP